MKPAGGLLVLAALAVAVGPVRADDVVLLDDFEGIEAWSAHPADGVEVTISRDQGVRGHAMRLDIRFVKGGGYAVVRRALPLTLPPNYRFRFQVRGEIPDNDLEFKLIAPDGENVWWHNQRSFSFPAEWRPVSIRKRQVEFAWGPVGGGDMREVGSLEFAVTAGSGGEGTVWIDELTLETLPEHVAAPAPVARASSSRPEAAPALALDGDSTSAWRPAAGDAGPTFDLDFTIDREFGGLVLEWAPNRQALDYDILTSYDGESWQLARSVRGSNGGRDPILLTESEARMLRVAVLRTADPEGVALAGIEVKPLEWGASREVFFKNLAVQAPRGEYPRAYVGEQSYWTVVGLDADTEEALLDEDGRLEAGRAQFSIEPFLFLDGSLVTWSDVTSEHALLVGQPLPVVVWRREGAFDLRMYTAALGVPGESTVLAICELRNRGSEPLSGTLFLAVRPFQVNPPQQSLGVPGGVARIRTIERDGRFVRVNGERRVVSLAEPTGFGAVTFDGGGIVSHLRTGELPGAASVSDPFEHASAAFAYAVDSLPPNGKETFALQVSLHGEGGLAPVWLTQGGSRAWLRALGAAMTDWRKRLEAARIEIPAREVLQALDAQVGWILINRDGPAIQPGSRSYSRSWIRDGSLTSTALLRLGHFEAVHEFIEWFAPHQYDDGKVPCCVDSRGSDPVPEHDSSGEFIYLVAEYVRHTGDKALAEQMWPRVAAAAAYLDSLRKTRRTAEYRSGPNAHFYGLLPPSISHEGYSAKPMHSYWDDFFALKGFDDAVYLAGVTGRPREAARLAATRDGFRSDLVKSIERSMKVHGIDFIPGAADLGDFDATSTTIALDPVGAVDYLPRAAVERTFERYWEFFRKRRDGEADWADMTPYEMRTIGAFVRLGWRQRAGELLDWFMTLRRPPGWNHWAEVVDKDPRRPRFIGDMPHTWVGSDFVRSVLDMLAYERPSDETLVVGAGVPWKWLEQGGVRVRGLSTSYGTLGYSMGARGDTVTVAIGDLDRMPAGGVVVLPPAARSFARVDVNGKRASLRRDGALVLKELPAALTFSP